MLRVRWWHLVHDDEEGLGLIEVMIALVVLSVAVLAMASVGTSSLISLRLTRDREQATNAASAAIEDARANPFDALANAGGSDPSSLPPDIRSLLDVTSSSCVGGEALVTDAASSRPIPLTRTAGTNAAHTVHTVVTWADSACGATGGDLKRVVTLVTWRDGGALNSVRNETLVAAAGRGLPNPNFDVRPSSGSVTLTAEQVIDRSTKCLEHQIRNLGAGDSYSYEVAGATNIVTGNAISVSPSGIGAFLLPTAGWQLEAYLEPASTPTRHGEPPESDAARFVPPTLNRPVAPLRLESTDQGMLTLCWTPTSDDAQDEVAVDIVVRSRFDDRRVEELSHTLRVGEASKRLYFQDWNDLVAHPRGEPRNNDQPRIYRAQVMNERSAGPSADRSQLPAPVLHNWSTEIGTSDLPGIRFPRVDSSNRGLPTLEYRYQLAEQARLLPGADLHVWLAPVTALTSASPAPTRMDLRIQLDVLTASDGNNNRYWPADAPLTYPHSYVHTAAGYQRLSIPLPFSDAPQLQPNHRIRVRITCLPTSESDCNLALDTLTHDSHLEVKLL